MSDLHVGLYTRPGRLRRFAREINALRPDTVAITGDFIDDDPHFTPKLLRGLSSVDENIPILMVLGNHEMYGEPFRVIEQLRTSRAKLLVNEGLAVSRGASTLWFAGLSDDNAGRSGRTRTLLPDLKKALTGRPLNSTTVILSHQPKVFDTAIRMAIPLTICGHTHGGQCGFRPLGWSLAGVFLPYHMGLYEREGSFLYVNTGTGYWLVPFRLGMTPEITLIELISD